MDHSKHTIETYNKLAEAYEEKFMFLELYNDSYDFFCELVKKPQAKIFEMGCGPGNITKYLLAKRPDFKVVATDAAPGMVDLAQKNNPAALCKTMDCRKIGLLTESFDGVVCGFCMPYLNKEECLKLIKDCGALMNSEGIFYLSVIEDVYEKSAFETSSNGQHTLFIYYHQAAYLEAGLLENGFELLHVIRKSYAKAGGANAVHLILIARKK